MSTETFTQEISKSSAWSIFLGVLTAIAGVIMLLYPAATSTVSTIFFGSALIVVSVAQFMFAFISDSAGNVFLKILLAILYGVAGVMLIAEPGEGVVSLTALLGVMLIAESIVETAVAFSLPAELGRGWYVLSAVTSFVLGAMILSSWPSSSAWAIGTMVGVAVLSNGITRIGISAAVHHEVSEFTQKTA